MARQRVPGLRGAAAGLMIGVVGLGTPLCRRLGIEHPVWCAGMGAAAGPDLVAAVSNAGGLGCSAVFLPLLPGLPAGGSG